MLNRADQAGAEAPPRSSGCADPDGFSLVEACCDRWADGSGRLALLRIRSDGFEEHVSHDALHATSARVAQVLRAEGIGRGDRVAVLLPQGAEAVIAMLAAWRLGAIVVPLARMLDAQALAFRLRHASAAALVTDDAGHGALAPLRADLPALRLVLSTEGARGAALSFWEEAGRAAAGTPAESVRGNDPAIILYTAGTAGPVRGVLHAHRALAGQLAGVAAQHDGFPRPQDRLWTPMDWAWRSGLFDGLLPALSEGVPVVAAPMARFDSADAVELMQRHGVRNAVLPSAALRLLRDSGVAEEAGLGLRSIGTCGEPPDPALRAWAAATLGAVLRHGHAIPECNLVLTGCEGLLPSGRPVPGHALAVLDAQGRPLPSWETGRLAVRTDHPGVFLGYWNDPAATAVMLGQAWMPTGDEAAVAEDGAILLPGPDASMPLGGDDGMGPDDVALCLRRHPAVALAAVIGSPDALAEDHATAIIVPRPEARPGPELAEALRDHMRLGMAGHRYPRRVAFAKALPRPADGRADLGTAVGLGAQRA